MVCYARQGMDVIWSFSGEGRHLFSDLKLLVSAVQSSFSDSGLRWIVFYSVCLILIDKLFFPYSVKFNSLNYILPLSLKKRVAKLSIKLEITSVIAFETSFLDVTPKQLSSSRNSLLKVMALNET
jgi:hypothetical protein